MRILHLGKYYAPQRGGIERHTQALAEACQPLLDHEGGAAGYKWIGEKFDTADGYGPTSVRHFVENSHILGDRSAAAWQQDAFGQVDAWLRALGLRV